MGRSYTTGISGIKDESVLTGHKKGVLILYDQLNLNRFPKWVKEEHPVIIFAEAKSVLAELPYHKKRLVYQVSAMRHFALECRDKGFPVYYKTGVENYTHYLNRILDQYKDLRISYMLPSEWNVRDELRSLADSNRERLFEIPNNFFLADVEEWTGKIEPGYRMEYFYREMRRTTGYLMDGDEPEGGEWNFDDQNRETLPQNYEIPQILEFNPDGITEEVISHVENEFPDNYGSTGQFRYAVTREQAMELLNQFVEERLIDFGPYEDAMAKSESTLFHSGLSLYLNNGLLLPEEVCEAAVKAYRQNDNIPINSVEGLIRQIIGWREFVRIYYEAMMPEARTFNHFEFRNSLPEFYWTGETNMYCLEECLKPVISDGYSHHIQRLMVLSNFSNLSKTDPRELNKWFRLAYVDAYEWVVLPNVLGMSTYADGGILASKPYVSSGNYINKMSDYCRKCSYNINKKTGRDACPFNYLYWNFVDEQRDTLNASGRSNFMVNMYERKSEREKRDIRESSEEFLSQLNREQNTLSSNNE